jgi:hypothetical protein
MLAQALGLQVTGLRVCVTPHRALNGAQPDRQVWNLKQACGESQKKSMPGSRISLEEGLIGE